MPLTLANWFLGTGCKTGIPHPTDVVERVLIFLTSFTGGLGASGSGGATSCGDSVKKTSTHFLNGVRGGQIHPIIWLKNEHSFTCMPLVEKISANFPQKQNQSSGVAQKLRK